VWLARHDRAQRGRADASSAQYSALSAGRSQRPRAGERGATLDDPALMRHGQTVGDQPRHRQVVRYSADRRGTRAGSGVRRPGPTRPLQLASWRINSQESVGSYGFQGYDSVLDTLVDQRTALGAR
jgi:iron complex transport system substrate-binding protein